MVNKVIPYEDETLDSWFKRTALANGFLDAKDFYYLACKKSAENQYYLRSLSNATYNDLFDVLGADNYAKTVLEHTYYPFVALFKSPYQQARILDFQFCNNGDHSTFFPTTDNYCPECMEENRYIRRSHNLYGVKACYKHKCALYDADNKPLLEEVSNDDVAYAKYAHKLLTDNHDFNAKQISLESRKDFEKAVRGLMAEYPEMNFPAVSKEDILNADKYEITYKSNNLCEVVHKDCGTHFCMNIFGLNHNINCPTCRPDDEFEQHSREVESVPHYKLIKYSQRAIILHHDVCNEDFSTRLESFMDGGRCKCETQRTAYTLKKINEEHPDYVFSNYVGRDQSIDIYHKTCGGTFHTSLNKWLKNPHCHCCEPNFNLSQANVKEKVESLGFIFRGFNEKTHGVELTCSEGHHFKRDYYTLLKIPTCPKCKQKNADTKANAMRQRLLNTYKLDDIICLDEFTSEEADIFGQVVRYGMEPPLVKSWKGIYGFKEFTHEEMLTGKYLVRNGKNIGYYYGPSFAYQLGLLDKAPDIPSIATSKTNKPHGSLVNFDNQRIRIKTTQEGFNGDNWKEAQLAEFITGMNNYLPTLQGVTPVLSKYAQENSIDLNEVDRLLPKRNVWNLNALAQLKEALYANQ